MKRVVRQGIWGVTAKTKVHLLGHIETNIVDASYNIYMYQGELNKFAK